MELTERHLESIIQTAEKVRHIDEKLDGIGAQQQELELRVRDLERRDAALAVIESLQETSEDHGRRIGALEKRDGARSSVETWKDLTYMKLTALLGAAGGAGAIVGWLIGLFGGLR